MSIQRILQPVDWGCLPTVAAMIVGDDTTYDNVIRDIGRDGEDTKGLDDIEISQYLLAQGFVMAQAVTPIGKTTEQKLRWINSLGIMSTPAVVTVNSMRFTNTPHVVLWTGKEVLDPNPEIVENLPLLTYTIQTWAPLGWLLESEDSLTP